MATVRVLVLRAAGINCDVETVHAWTRAGAQPDLVHLHRLAAAPGRLEQAQVLTIPGGFSYGDDLGAGRVFAAQLRRLLMDPVRRFIERGGLVLGICNGFQILVKAGLLPDSSEDGDPGACTVTRSDPPLFQDRWVALRATDSPCVFVEPGAVYEMPIAHGEGRVLFADDGALQAVLARRQNALVYCAAPGETQRAETGDNPNGSAGDIGGLCDQTGRVLGLMPHPDRFVDATQHPLWTSRPLPEAGDGLRLFQRAVAYFQ